MIKRRKTSSDERIEIVEYCIAHNHNYFETAKKYQVFYQQARNYTVKYKSGGVETLKANRGKPKSVTELSELVRLRAEKKILRGNKFTNFTETMFWIPTFPSTSFNS